VRRRGTGDVAPKRRDDDRCRQLDGMLSLMAENRQPPRPSGSWIVPDLAAHYARSCRTMQAESVGCRFRSRSTEWLTSSWSHQLRFPARRSGAAAAVAVCHDTRSDRVVPSPLRRTASVLRAHIARTERSAPPRSSSAGSYQAHFNPQPPRRSSEQASPPRGCQSSSTPTAVIRNDRLGGSCRSSPRLHRVADFRHSHHTVQRVPGDNGIRTRALVVRAGGTHPSSIGTSNIQRVPVKGGSVLGARPTVPSPVLPSRKRFPGMSPRHSKAQIPPSCGVPLHRVPVNGG